MVEKLSEDLKIKIILEGTSNNGHNIPLSEFLSIAGSCHGLLKQTAQSVLKDCKYEFLISSLTHNSPACVYTVVKSTIKNAGHLVVSDLSKQARKIQLGDGDSLPDDVLKAWQKLLNYDKSKVSMLKVQSVGDLPESQNSTIFEANAGFEDALNNAINGALNRIVCHTSIVGRVDSVDLHNLGKGTLKAYTDVPQWDAVPVNFDYKFKRDVINAIEKVVRIYGEARYQFGKAMPVSMDMDRIEILTEGSMRLADLEGVAPNITGDKSMQEYLDSLRGEWD